tara:strand:+ start:430 stop:807 length:378 start_codon:yes stop_codon:yes gene_type:complete
MIYSKVLIKPNLLITSLIFFFFTIQVTANDSSNLYEISNELMCPVCQGQTVAESNSKLAISMRDVIKQKISEGKNKNEILNYFTGIYGDNILATPPVKGLNILLYLVPILFLVISIFYWYKKVKK